MITVYDTAIAEKAKQAAKRSGMIDQMVKDARIKVSEENLEIVERLIDAGWRKWRLCSRR
jgi:hypothetical protein